MSQVGRQARRLLVAELRSYRALARWLTPRPDVPPGATGFRHIGVILPVLWTFIGVSTVELVAVHLLLPWPGVRVVVDVLGAWGLLWMVGLTAALSIRPHVIDGSVVRIRSGTAAEVTVPWDTVAGVAVRRRMREKSRGIQLDRHEAGAVLNLVAGNPTNVDLALRPLDLALPDGSETVSAVRLYCDDPGAFVAAARERLDAAEDAAGRR